MAKKNKKVPATSDAAAGGKKPSRRERKRQKKELLKEQLALEKQLVDEGRIPARNRYRAKGFFWRVFALCLAFLFGLLAAVGAFFGFGAFAPAKDVFRLFGFDPSSLLYDEYAAQSFFDIARGIASDSFDSLAALSKYTPVIDGYLDVFSQSLADLGVHIDKERVKEVPFADLGAYFRDEVIGNVVLGEALHVTANGNNRFMLAVCYGNLGTDYTVNGNGEIVPITAPVTIGMLADDSASVISRVTVEDALGVTAQSNAAMRFLAYGTEGLNYRVNGAGQIEMLENELTGALYEKKTLSNLTTDGATPIESAKISDLIDVGDASGILGAIRDWSIADLKQSYRIERLKISQVMEIGESSSRLAKAIQNWRLSDLTDAGKMDTLTLGQVVGVGPDSPPILRALEETPLGELDTTVDSLRLLDILDEKDFEGNNFLKPLKLSSLTDLGEDLKKLSAREIFGGDMFAYLEREKYSGKSYWQLYKEYEATGHSDPENHGTLPEMHELAPGESVGSYFVHADETTRLKDGFLLRGDGTITPVEESEVFSRKTEEGTGYYIKGEQKLDAGKKWQVVDYDSPSHLADLPEEDRISADPADRALCAVRAGEGEPYCDGEGRPYYYITARVKFADGAPTEETEKVAYPIMQDGYGVYYEYLRYTPDGGAASFSEQRVDLDETVVQLSYREGEETVILTRNVEGKWSYRPKDGEEDVAVEVYEREAVHDEDTGTTTPAYYYFRTETPIERGYYAEEGEITEVYTEDVTEKFEIVAEGADPIAVERVLSGVWYFLLGGEDKSGFTDRSDTPVLELTGLMNGMSDKFTDTALWKLYFHGLLTKDPYVDLSAKFEGGVNIGGADAERKVTNLNECTLAESVELVKKLVSPTE